MSFFRLSQAKRSLPSALVFSLLLSLFQFNSISNAAMGREGRGGQGNAPVKGVVPDCVAYGDRLMVDNNNVLTLKKTTPNAYKTQAYVEGKVVVDYGSRNGHLHFGIQIGENANEVIEVVYNVEFGSAPQVKIGTNIKACGEYITSTAQTGAYPPSPAGAIIHWVHSNPKNAGHDHGFLVFDDLLVGYDLDGSRPVSGRRPTTPGAQE